MTMVSGAEPNPLKVPLWSVVAALARADDHDIWSAGLKIGLSTGVLKSPPTMAGAFLPAISWIFSMSSFTPSSRAALPLWSRWVLK